LSDRPQSEVRGEAAPPRRLGRIPLVPLVIAAGVVVVAATGGLLTWRAEARTNKVALASSPRPVTVSVARSKLFRPVHTYVGAMRAWVEAKVGPQYISAYVETVLVRPGSNVKKGDVLATLDCRYPSAEQAAIQSKARAIATRQLATEHEAERTSSLLDGGFVSVNESEVLTARSNSEAAELASERANLLRSGLDVGDCVLRSPFDGEVSLRLVDPGTFVRPNTEMIRVVDRSVVRMTADAPESDFEAIAPGSKVVVHVVSIALDVPATISRRAPSADPGTRTVHFEVDIHNADRRIPVDTTGEVHVPAGKPVPATAVPLKAASTSEDKATLFALEGDTVRKKVLAPLGEVGPDVFFDGAALAPGTSVVVEGRSGLKDGDRVTAKTEEPTSESPDPGQGPTGAK
jgi:membrane fusion protein, multidrug efflux system